MFLIFPECKTVETAFDKLRVLCADVTSRFPRPVKWEAEKCIAPSLFLGKKRYIGRFHLPGETPKMNSKGLEKNRLDNAPIVRTTMTKITSLIMEDNNLSGALAYVNQVATDLIQRRTPIAELVVTKSISRPDYKMKPLQVYVAERMHARDPSYTFGPGERIPFIIVNNGNKGKNVPLSSRAEDPCYALQHNLDVDIGYYLIKQLANPLARILMWYIGPKDMMEEIHSIERLRPVPHKILQKSLDRMIAWTATRIFGIEALAKIPRPPPRHNGIMDRFVTRRAKTEEELERCRDQADILAVDLEECKQKCVKCRGYSETVTVCVARDCVNLLRQSEIKRDMEDLFK